MKQKYLYMLVSRDKYELPIIVADSAGILARKLGIQPHSIMSTMINAKMQGYRCQYVKVEYDEDNE